MGFGEMKRRAGGVEELGSFGGGRWRWKWPEEGGH